MRKVAVVSGRIQEPEIVFHRGGEVTIFSFEEGEKWYLTQDWGDGRLADQGSAPAPAS